ncbi:hypothetical protein BGW36DRAFT_158539 [Talaromyces proteolyticus]|uniref:Uncharacterized protein n=1 Tax=Talaromyces proteolyticus TaxID=1131652 RepID=A0AAD4KSE7_9EURO|nr:uncharacterized protein BGW36DRAFT_158539 [Talaromyces proteolyticus]KAH8699289.1 hypothetical protein BGW36DRAFT_158539 [Talaromyces proteolyticus]
MYHFFAPLRLYFDSFILFSSTYPYCLCCFTHHINASLYYVVRARREKYLGIAFLPSFTFPSSFSCVVLLPILPLSLYISCTAI